MRSGEMEMTGRFAFAALAALSLSASAAAVPSPEEVSRRISEQFLSTRPDAYEPVGMRGHEYVYGDGRHIHYSTVSLWVNALECARLSGQTDLLKRLIEAYRPYEGERSYVFHRFKHVDWEITGAVPLEIAILTKDAKAGARGLWYADRQWEEPRREDDTKKAPPATFEERTAWWKQGYTSETRLWIDDMYMISLLQLQAYRYTGKQTYLDRAAKEMSLYIDRLPQRDGLFCHAVGCPFIWARGDGWMAAAMPMLLKELPDGHPHRGKIMRRYREMMAALLRHQRENGLWGQLVDDLESWDETSGSAMYAYAFAEGVRNGWLGAEYSEAVKRAYAALVARLDEHANLADVCIGTGARDNRDWYMKRSRVNGDPHGQAPLLWLCRVLIEGRSPAGFRPVFSCDRADAIYRVGEPARITVRLCGTNGLPVVSGRYRIKVTNFGDKVLERKDVEAERDGTEFTFTHTSDVPGFVRAEALSWDASRNRWEPAGCFGVAFSPYDIRPGAECPADFNDFWKSAVAKYDRAVTAPIRAEKVDEKDGMVLYELAIPTVGGRTLWGYLQEPADAGRNGKTYPAVVSVPGAGPSSFVEIGWRRDRILLTVNVHYYRPVRGAAKSVRERMQKDEDEAWAKRFPVKYVRYTQTGIAASREDYFYYGAILGISRTVDWLAARPGVDRSRFAYNGTSQGGGFGLILCGLNGNFTAATVYVPALTDLLGFRAEGRESGWPRLIENQLDVNRAAAERNAPYFCGVNFARNIRIPIRYEVGAADMVCPPMAGFSAYNVTPSADKAIVLGVGQGHEPKPELRRKLNEWLDGMLK